MKLPDRPITSALIYRSTPQEAQLWYDSEKDRICIKLRWIRRNMVKVELATLVDYDPDKQKWCTQLSTHYSEVEGWRACDKLFADVVKLAEEQLAKDERNSTWQRSWYYPK